MIITKSLVAVCCLVLSTFEPILSVVEPCEKALNQEVAISVEKLSPLTIVEIEASATDCKGEGWSSHAFFQADALGQIDLRRDHPLSGSSYDDIDSMGLFWSMVPDVSDSNSIFQCAEDCFAVELKAFQEGKLIGEKTITRFLKVPEVQRIEIRENGLVGTLFLPPSEEPLPVIITLSGSNGGLSESRAKLLSSNGFATLALAYFREGDLPSRLQRIPLEYFETALDWLKNQERVDGSRVGLYGVSRGAELALILGTVFPDRVQAIVAVAPSCVVWPGSGTPPIDAWLYKKEPLLPFAPVALLNLYEANGPVRTREGFLQGMKDAEATIPVENIRCPLLLVSGGDDGVWPSDLFATRIMKRLEKKGSSIFAQHLHYPEAGHGINVPILPIPESLYFHPVCQVWFSFGGSRAADANASNDSWKRLLGFFSESLSRTGDSP